MKQEEWLAKFARLRIDTASNAPHKALLLLVVLDLAEEGQLAFDEDPHSLPERPKVRGMGSLSLRERARVREALLPLTPQLAFRFCSDWSSCFLQSR